MPGDPTQATPNTGLPLYLVIGHVACDLTPEGPRPGGTALYSALTAQRLGFQAAVVTAFADSDDWLVGELLASGVWVWAKPSPATTTFANTYDSSGARSQVLAGQADPLSIADVPPEWLEQASIIHLGPIARELPTEMPGSFKQAILGITPQGWLRSWDVKGKVSHQPHPIPPALAGLPSHSLVVMSQEDLNFDREVIADYTRVLPLLVVTNGPRPASIFVNGEETPVPAHRAVPIDLTGAGDVFAAALFIRFSETQDLLASVSFAHAAAALSISAHGTAAIPTRPYLDTLLATSH